MNKNHSIIFVIEKKCRKKVDIFFEIRSDPDPLFHEIKPGSGSRSKLNRSTTLNETFGILRLKLETF